MSMNRMPRLTPARLVGILAAEPKAVARLDDDENVIGVDLPLPDGMAYADGSRTKTALFGDRVGQDQHGQWLVVPAPRHPA
ncbi:hypothetical protein OG762_36600 [Streptomyces sp. NBC_01136]|uniref:hypothetical protein n=1 Tax=unclassified Streptomyces TaxID=2593676 RepID=UPI003245B67A|nr:hypothetical protein OG762_36600 [Streptomyces sp. NBC_01136]